MSDIRGKHTSTLVSNVSFMRRGYASNCHFCQLENGLTRLV